MLKTLLFSISLFSIFSLRVYALIPTLYLENIYEEDKVFLKVQGEPNAPVALFYTPDFASTSLSAIVGWTDDKDGIFWKVIKTSTYRIDSHVPVFVIINGYTSATATWPYSPPVVPSFSVATTTVELPLLSTSTIEISGNGHYYISDNQSAFIASATTSTTTLSLFGKMIGTTSINVCQSGSTCAVIPVKVVATSTPAPVSSVDASTSLPMTTSNAPTIVNYPITPLSSLPITPSVPSYVLSPYKFSQSLRYGSRGNEVEELQKRLALEGFFGATLTGYYGAVTAYAVREYQRFYNLPILGIVGPMTREQLNRQS